jgi:hypothetical protein
LDLSASGKVLKSRRCDLFPGVSKHQPTSVTTLRSKKEFPITRFAQQIKFSFKPDAAWARHESTLHQAFLIAAHNLSYRTMLSVRDQSAHLPMKYSALPSAMESAHAYEMQRLPEPSVQDTKTILDFLIRIRNAL